MPDEPHDETPPGQADQIPLIRAQLQPTIEQRVVALEAKQRAREGAEPTNRLLGDVKTGEWWMIGINGLLLVATIVIACIYSKQLGEMRRATQATEQSAYAACLAAQISQISLMQSELVEADAHGSATAAIYQAMAATQSERAEMQLMLGKAEIRVGKDFGVDFNTNNAGKTAAVDLAMDFRMVFLPRSEDPDFRYPERLTVHGDNGRAEPGPTFQTGTHRVIAIGPDEKAIVPQEEDTKEYLAGAKDMILYGRMTYRDIFGGHHWRHYCQPFQVFPQDTLISKPGHDKCGSYNQSDTGSSLIKTTPAPVLSSPIAQIACKKPE